MERECDGGILIGASEFERFIETLLRRLRSQQLRKTQGRLQTMAL